MFNQQLLIVVVLMQMILVEHLLGFADDGSATLIDFDSPTTFKQLHVPNR